MTKDWEEIIKDKFATIRGITNEMEKQLLKQPDGVAALNFLRPLEGIVFEAWQDVCKHRKDHEGAGGDILNQIDL